MGDESKDPYQLSRFVEAQGPDYSRALAETAVVCDVVCARCTSRLGLRAGAGEVLPRRAGCENGWIVGIDEAFVQARSTSHMQVKRVETVLLSDTLVPLARFDVLSDFRRTHMRISFNHVMMTALCGALFTACGAPDRNNGSASSSSSVSSSSGGEGGMAGGGGSAGGGMGGGGNGGAGGGGGGNNFSASGTVSAPNVPAGSKLVVVWSVSASSPDYVYKWGEGTADAAKFSVTLMGDPPPEAINAGFAGVGYLLAMPSNFVLPDGQLTSTQADNLFAMALGYSAQHAIIFHPNTSQSPYPWSSQFSNGYQCAKCAPMGGTFDHWAPTDCANIIIVDTSQPSCNWT